MKEFNNAKKEILNKIIIIKKKTFIFFVFDVFLNSDKINKNYNFYYNF